MNEERDEWERWQEDWQGAGEMPDARQLPARRRRERRRMLLATAAEAALALAACGGVAAAPVATPRGVGRWWGVAGVGVLGATRAEPAWERRGGAGWSGRRPRRAPAGGRRTACKVSVPPETDFRGR